MKRTGLFVVLLMGAFLAPYLLATASNSYSWSPLAVPSGAWRSIGTLTAAYTYPVVGERDYNDVTVDIPDANSMFLLDIPETANNIEFRFEGTADSNTATVAILVAAGDYLNESSSWDDFGLGASLALTVGTQVGGGSARYYVDTIVVTDGLLDLTAYDSAANRIATAAGNLRRYRKIAVIATSLDTATLRGWVRYY